MCRRVTVYTSSRDRALKLSDFLHQAPRAGETSSQRPPTRIDIIDASAAKLDWLGHSYDSPPLFADIRNLLHGLKLEERAEKTLTQDRRTKIYRLIADAK